MPLSAEEKKTALALLGQLRRAALAGGCTMIRLVSQAVGPLQDALDARGSGKGVCQEMVIQWLAARKGGRDYLGTITGAGGAARDDDVDVLVRDHKGMGELDRRKQRVFVKERMADLKLVARPADVKNCGGLGIASVAEWACAQPGAGQMRMIGIRGGCDHALAIDLTPGREAFFDPNLGEFQFHGRLAHMTAFLQAHVFIAAHNGKDIGHYLGRPKMPYAQVEKYDCS